MSKSQQLDIKSAEVKDQWDTICKNAPGATFFHTPIWSEILERSFPVWRSAPVLLELSGGNTAIIPRMVRRLPGTKKDYSESMVPGVYGGPLFALTPSAEDWQDAWNLINDRCNMIILGNPFIAYPDYLPGEKRPMFTQALFLKRDFDMIKRRFSKGHKANIKGAQRMGVRTKVAAAYTEVDEYYNLYRDSLRRWGKSARGFYPKRLFHNMIQHPAYGSAIKIWIAHLDGKAVAGACCLYHNNHAVYWHGVVSSQYMQFHPGHLLLSTVIEDACSSAFDWFDFNPSGGLKGVEEFKSRFGARPMQFYAYRRLNSAGKAFRFYRHLKERYLRRCSLS